MALQLLLRREPGWRRMPVAVVDDDRPQGVILWVNERARRSGVLSGMRYAAGLSLCRELRAGMVSAQEIAAEGERLTGVLRAFSPNIERSEEPGVFWVDASGLEGIHPSLQRWGEGIRAELRGEGFVSSVVVGFRRFTSYAIASNSRGVCVFVAPRVELAEAWRVPLARLDIAPKFRDALARLSVHTVGDLVKLPERGLRSRFGARAATLHRWGRGEVGAPLQAEEDAPPPRVRREFLQPIFSTTGLLFSVKGALAEVLAGLARRGEVLAELAIEMKLDHADECAITLRPAEPTLDEMQLVDLVRLKLESEELAAPVEEIVVSAQGAPGTTEQLDLFVATTRRDLRAANRALARVRAELGDDAVVRAELREGHLPEARYAWVPLEQLRAPQPREDTELQLVRSVLPRPDPLTRPSRPSRDDGWLLARPKLGSVTRSAGPFVISGGWWHREIHRSYHFVETQRGDLLWVYLDKRRRRWFLHGVVE